MTSASLPDAIAAARSALAALDPPPPPYPLEALGPLAEAADALSRGAQVHPALAGQAMLVAASCRIPDDWIVPSRHAYLLAVSVLRELLGSGSRR